MKPKGWLPFWLSLLISAALLTWLLRRIDIQEIGSTLSSIYLPALFLFIGVSLAGTLMRAWRYKLLLYPEPIAWGPVLGVTLIRNLFVDLLPARIGSLSYVYVLNRRLGFPLSAAASTFLLAMLLDFLTLSPFLVASLVWVGLGPSLLPIGWMLGLALLFFLVMLAILWKIVPFIQWLVRILLPIFNTFSKEEHKLSVRIRDFADKITLAFQDFQARQVFWPLYGLSLLIRMAKYLSLYGLLWALLHSHGFALKSLSFSKTILSITAAEFTSVLPVKGLAGFGTWETAWSLAFQMMDLDPKWAVLSGIGIHLITNLFEYTLGILALMIIFSPLLPKPGKEFEKTGSDFRFEEKL